MMITVGYNMCGYLPEVDPVECESLEEAWEYLRSEMSLFAEFEYEQFIAEGSPIALREEYNSIAREVDRLSDMSPRFGDWFLTTLTGVQWCYWITESHLSFA